jgi:hypothetical protein
MTIATDVFQISFFHLTVNRRRVSSEAQEVLRVRATGSNS